MLPEGLPQPSLRPLRVLYWTQLFRPYIGGVEVVAAQLLPALQARGYECCVVTSHGGLDLADEDAYDGIPVYRFPFQGALSRGNMQLLAAARSGVARVKRIFRPDLVHINLSDPGVFFHLHTQAAHPAPSILSVRLALPDHRVGLVDTLLGRALGMARWVVANSEAILADVRELLPAVTSRSSVIHCGLELPNVEPEALPFARPQLLCLGRVVEDKGFDLAIAAFAELADRFPTLRLVIAGDGPARPELERQAAALGIGPRVDFLGWVAPQKVPRLLNAATVVLMPSRWREAFGLVALQAAQMARPVVAARVGGLPEVVADGETGLLVERNDRHALATAVARLLDHPDAARAMGDAARRRAQRVFSWRRYVDAHDALYRRVVAGGVRC
jgi:glycogen synthase